MRGSSCARPQAAVPAVSENHPPVDRLLGGQHCGWLSEIRSEVSTPARLCPRNVDAIWGAFVPTDSWFGRAEVTDEGLSFRRTSQATAGSARTRQGTSGSLEPPFAAAPSDDGHCEPKRRRKPRPPRRSAVISHQPRPRNAPQRASADHRRADRVAYARQQLRAASGRLPPLRTTGTANPSAGASRDHRGAAPSPRTNLTPETHPSSRAATTAAWTAPSKRGSDCAQPQAVLDELGIGG